MILRGVIYTSRNWARDSVENARDSVIVDTLITERENHMPFSSPHFTEDEMQCKCGCKVNGVTQRLLDALEELRSTLDKPIIVMSGFRCKDHNKAIGGSRYSQHMLGNAADIRVNGMTPAQLEAEAQKVPAFRDGGIGRNDHSNFVHVDVRTHLARWCYSENGQECDYYPPA